MGSPPTLRISEVLVVKQCYPCVCFTPGFLNLRVTDILDKIYFFFFFMEGCPECCRMFSSIPALYPLDASIELQDSENTNAEDPGKFEFQINIEKNFSLICPNYCMAYNYTKKAFDKGAQ